MSKPANRPRHLLERLLDAPDLALVVPRMAPESLHQLIRHCGLESCGALMASATPAQLASVLDLDLWRQAEPGRDDRFDANRFGEWLDVLVDTDASTAARIVAAMEPRLVVAGLSQFVRVFDPATFEPTFASDDEPAVPETGASGSSEFTVGGYLVRAVSADAWDAVLALLVALETEHPASFHEVMRGCRKLSNSAPEVDGLDDLLAAPDQLMHDMSLDRERRRSSQGYSTPADARAFLEMARQRQRVPDGSSPVNPLVGAYFRAADGDTPAAGQDTRGITGGLPASPTTEAPPDVPAPVIDVLMDARTPGHRPRGLPGAPTSETSRLTQIQTLMARLHEHDPAAYLARTHELTFLANTLVAGCSIQDRTFTAEEASEAAVSTCNLGLERWSAQAGEAPADRDLITAFELGWSMLHTSVCTFAADELVTILKTLRCVDAELQMGLRALQVEMAKQLRAGTPWRARKALDVIQMLDTPAWAALIGLIDECPTMPDAVSATTSGRTTTFSATAFAFIATLAQIVEIREFMARLPDILAG